MGNIISKVTMASGDMSLRAGAVPRVTVDSTSTSTAFTATSVPSILALEDGSCVYITNNKVTSASNCTLNVNGLGAKPIYMSNAASTRVTTQWVKDTTCLFVYNSTRVTDGCWDLVVGYDTNGDTKVTQSPVTDNASYPILCAPSGQSTETTTTTKFDSGVTLNPSTNTISANISGNAATATSATSAASATTADTATKLGSTDVGSAIKGIYLDDGVPTACTYTVEKSVPSNAVFTDTNTKVNVTLGTTTKAYLLGTSTTPTSSAQGVTAIADTGVYLDTTAGQLTATKFSGNLSGTADRATKLAATQKGNTTTPVYISSDGVPTALGYSFETSLTSDSDAKVPTSQAVATYVGAKIDEKIAAADAMIYKGTIGADGATISTKILPNDTAKTGWTYKAVAAGDYTVGTGTTTGTTTVHCEIGDMIICLTDGSSSVYATWTVVQNNVDLVGAKNSIGLIKNGSDVTSSSGYTASPIINGIPYYKDTNNDTKVTQSPVTDNASYPILCAPSGQSAETTTTAKFDSGVTLNPSTNTITANISGNAATATSATSATTATKADKINTSAKIGDTNKPVYVAADGTVTAISYTIDKSVPSNAVFTDTNTKVTQTLVAADNTSEYPLLLAPTGQIATATTTSNFVTAAKYKPSTNTASINISGNAATATTATKLGSSDVGTATKAVYLAAGVPTACTYSVEKSVPSNAVFTDVSVTASSNHYTPATASGQDKSASASGATAAWSIDVVKGVTLNTDGKGHVTGISVTSGKIPGNPNTDEKVKNTYGTANTYYPAGMTATSTTTGGQNADTAFKYTGTTGDTSTVGKAELTLGNSTASGTAGNKQGSLVIYGSTAYKHTISGAPTADRALTLPNKGGTIAVTDDIKNNTLTIKGAGTSVTTFTANSSSDQSFDIVGTSNVVTVSADATNHRVTINALHPTFIAETETLAFVF